MVHRIELTLKILTIKSRVNLILKLTCSKKEAEEIHSSEHHSTYHLKCYKKIVHYPLLIFGHLE